MSDLLVSLYPWIKALHVISVVAWMAGMFYLPRLYVYHAESVETGSDTDQLFQTMERRLLRAIMNPAMIATWIFGLILVFTPGVVDWHMAWPWTKAVAVLTLSWMHGWLATRRKDFAAGRNTRSGRTYRMMNELPTLVLIVAVVFGDREVLRPVAGAGGIGPRARLCAGEVAKGAVCPLGPAGPHPRGYL